MGWREGWRLRYGGDEELDELGFWKEEGGDERGGLRI